MAVLYEVHKPIYQSKYEISDPDSWIRHTVTGAFATARLQENEDLKEGIYKKAKEYMEPSIRKAAYFERTSGQNITSVFPEIIKDMEQCIEFTTAVYARVADGLSFNKALIAEGIRDRDNLTIAGLSPNDVQRKVMTGIFFATDVYNGQSASDAFTRFSNSLSVIRAARQAIFSVNKLAQNQP